MNELKSFVINTIPGLSSESRGIGVVNNEADAYAKVPLIFRAIRLRCNSLTRVPFEIYNTKTDEVIDQYEFEDSFPMHDLLWKSEVAILLKGVAYLLKLQNQYAFGKGLQWLNPFSVQSQVVDGRLEFWQEVPGTGRRFPESGFLTVEDFIYLKDFNPSDDLGPGVSATQVAIGDAKAAGNVTAFLSNYFGGDALPVTMVTLPAGTLDAERSRVQKWFEDRFTIFKKLRERILAVTADVKIERLTPELQTFEFEKIDDHTAENIADAFDIPVSLLRSNFDSHATADVAMRNFLEHTIVPRCRYYEMMLNPYLKEFDQRIEFCEQELPELQEDETARAASLKALTDAGVPLQAAIIILGYDVNEEAQKILDKYFADKAKQDAQPKQLPPAVDPKTGMPMNQPMNGNGVPVGTN